MRTRARRILAVLLFAAIPVVATADLASGADLGFSPFYAAPVGVLAWEFGRFAGIVGAVVSGLLWAFADHVNRPALDLAAETWNAGLRITGLVTLAYLLSVVRRAQNDLRVALSQREEFLALVAHEIRAPVAAIEIVATALVRSSVGETDHRKALQQLVDQSRDLRTLAEDILSIGRLEAGMEHVAAETFDLVALLAEIQQRHDRLRLEAPASPLRIRADRQQIRRAITNVVNNALKFSGDAPVVLTLTEKDARAELSVTDKGIGLGPGEAVTVFEKYGRVDDPIVRRIPGVGLGLYLSRLLLRINDGTIEATSPGRGLGSTFVIRLPVADTRSQQPVPLPRGSDA